MLTQKKKAKYLERCILSRASFMKNYYNMGRERDKNTFLR